MILDIGTHVLAMLRETLHASGSDTALSLSLRVAKDRLGHGIAPGDTVTAEGEAHLQGTLGTIPLNIWLNKYAGRRRAKGNADRAAGRANPHPRPLP